MEASVKFSALAVQDASTFTFLTQGLKDFIPWEACFPGRRRGLFCSMTPSDSFPAFRFPVLRFPARQQTTNTPTFVRRKSIDRSVITGAELYLEDQPTTLAPNATYVLTSVVMTKIPPKKNKKRSRVLTIVQNALHFNTQP